MTGEPKSNKEGILFGVLLGALGAYQLFKLPPAMPLLIERYGYSKLLAGSFMSVYSLTGLIFTIYLGGLLGRRGPWGLLGAALIFTLLGNAIALLYPESGALMLGGRFLEGIAFAIIAIAGAVIASSSASPRTRPIAIALWATWIPMGQIASSIIAIGIVGEGHWRPLWWVAIAASLLMALWGLRIRSVGGLTFPEAEAESGVEKSAAKMRETLLLTIAGCLFALWGMQYIGFMSWLPQYLVEAGGITPGKAAIVYLFPPILVALFNVLAGFFLRAGMTLRLLIVSTIIVEAIVWMLIPVMGTGVVGAVALGAYAIASGLTPTGLFALPGAISGDNPASASRAFAFIMTGRNMGALAGPIVIAQAVTIFGGWNIVGPLFGAIMTVAAVLALYLTTRIQRGS
ncbi:MAG: hypothetical protein C0609_00370 [Deltaproteobacteria bacterium]|nr:MAG: hypothetical protein C0609_00370 [Deltaproteobacteria bacterium]